MSTLMKWLSSLALVVAVLPLGPSGPASGTPPDVSLDPRTPLKLLTEAEEVQEEVKVTADQRAAAGAIRQRLERGQLSAEQAMNQLAAVLKPGQWKRLNEASWQARGGAALIEPVVASAVELADGQKRELAEIWSAATREVRDHLERARFPSETARRAYIVKRLDQAGDRMLALLTEQQQARFRTLQGAKCVLPEWARPVSRTAPDR